MNHENLPDTSGQQHRDLSGKKRMLEMHALQAHLVSVLLRHVNGQSQISAAVGEIEKACKRIFFSSRRSCDYNPFPVVLDVLLVLYKENPNFAGELMSCVVLLCLCSIQGWHHAVESALFDIFPHSAHLLAKVAITKNPYWSHWSQEEQEKCATACMDLSDLDKYIKVGYLLRTTPLSVSVRGFKTNLRLYKSVDISGAESDVRIFVNSIPPKIWSTIPHCDFSFLLKAAEAEVPKARYMSRIAISHEIRALAVRKSSRFLEQHGHFVTKDGDAEPGPFPIVKNQFVGPCSAQIDSSLYNTVSLTEREAYELAKMSTHKKTISTLLLAAGEWIKLGQTNLLCAAYIGAPKLLNHLAGCLDTGLEDVQKFPLSYISPVDQKIDRALCNILRYIPEVGASLCSGYAKDGDGCSDLKKAALMYPSLTLRRTKCLCAAGQTLLTGLSHPSNRFNSQSLLALKTLLSALVALPGSPKPEVEDFCLAVFDFVLEEKRLDNGVPDCLTSLLISTLSFLCRCKLEQGVAILIDRLDSVTNAKCFSEVAAENARLLRSYLLGRQ